MFWFFSTRQRETSVVGVFVDWPATSGRMTIIFFRDVLSSSSCLVAFLQKINTRDVKSVWKFWMVLEGQKSTIYKTTKDLPLCSDCGWMVGYSAEVLYSNSPCNNQLLSGKNTAKLLKSLELIPFWLRRDTKAPETSPGQPSDGAEWNGDSMKELFAMNLCTTNQPLGD